MIPFKHILLFAFSVITFFSFSQEVQDTTNKKAPEEEFYKAAVKLIDSSRYKDAIINLKKAVKIKPDYIDAFTKMGYAKVKTNDTKGAEKDLNMALKYAPNNFEALKTLGIMYYNSDRMKESKLFMDSAASQKIDDAEFYYFRSQLMFKGKDNKSALGMADAAIETNPKYIDAFILKARIRFAMKEWNYVIKELNEAIKMMPADKPVYEAYKLRAKAKFEVQDYKGAITDWNVYIEANPKEEEALISRGAAKINVNDYTTAIVDLDEAIKINGKNPVSYNYRGIAKGENKQIVEGLKDLDYSIKLKFDYAAAYVNRAALKFTSKDKRGACDDLNKADSLGDQMAYKLIEKYCKNMQN